MWKCINSQENLSGNSMKTEVLDRRHRKYGIYFL